MKTIVGSALTLWAFSLLHAVPVAAQAQGFTKVGVVLISLDPKHDNPAKLRAMAAERHVDPTQWTLAAPKPDPAPTEVELAVVPLPATPEARPRTRPRASTLAGLTAAMAMVFGLLLPDLTTLMTVDRPRRFRLRLRFGFERANYDMKTRLLVVAHADRLVGLLVDSAREFITIPPEAIQPPPEAMAGTSGRYLHGVAHLGDRIILILDVAGVLDAAVS